MYLTQKNQIRSLTSKEFTALRELCRLSKNLYNVGLYTVRQYYFQDKKHLHYESNYHYCKTNENYKRLNTDIAQQTLKVVDRTFRSFYGLINAAKSGNYQQKVRLPHYLPKDGYFTLLMPKIRIKVADNKREYQFSGKRIKRGLYRTKHGFLVNADVNGAANILKKSKHKALSRVSRGCLAQPLRVKIS